MNVMKTVENGIAVPQLFLPLYLHEP